MFWKENAVHDLITTIFISTKKNSSVKAQVGVACVYNIFQNMDTSKPSTTRKRKIERKHSKNVTNKKVHSTKHKIDVKDNDVTLKYESAFDGKTKSYTITLYGMDHATSVQDIFNDLHDTISSLIRESVINANQVKVTLDLEVCRNDYEYETYNFGATADITLEAGVEPFVDDAAKNIQSKYNTCISTPESIQFLNLYLHIHEIVASPSLQLPESFLDHVVDLEVNDDTSFKWSVLAALHPEVELELLEEYSDDLVMDGIDSLVQLDDIPHIEDMNTFSINVFMLNYNYELKDSEIGGPVHHTKTRKGKHINLLLLHDNDRTRFCYISDLKGLVCPLSINKHLCDGCLTVFDKHAILHKHQQEECPKVKIAFPKEKSMSFCNTERLEDVPFVVYADFEALLEVMDNKSNNTQAYARNIRKHVPYSYGYYIKCIDDTYSKLETYVGPDCVSKFTFNLKNHLTEQYLKYCRQHDKIFTDIQHVPVFLHNLEQYDCHFLIGGGNWSNVLGDLHNYFAMHTEFSIGFNTLQLRVLDSRKFVKDSLKRCVEGLDECDFNEIKQICKTNEDLQFLRKKGVFPYNYIKSFKDLNKTFLPEKFHFYDDLTESDITDEKYVYALKVWDHFRCNTILDYSILYLKTDVLLLADVIENLRRSCKINYGLDLAHYYSLSTFSWDAMLKHTNMKLQLLSDPEMINFINKGIRGGIAHCIKRHVVANNKYLKTYNTKLEDSYIMYYDANNLYGYVMSQPLPYSGFKWVDVDSIDIYNVPEDSDVGYILEVDLTYPKELHDMHSDLPFCAEKKIVPLSNTEFLTTNLTSKQNYVIHYSYLKLCMEHGLKIHKIKRVLKFKQKAWIKPYIDFNNERRSIAKTEFDKNIFKQLNNVIYGKSMQRSDYATIKLFDHWGNIGRKRGAFNIIGQPNYSSHTICSKSTIAVKLQPPKVVFKTPIYIGFSILDLSKKYMYDFHYNVMKKRFGDKLFLLYTDTDSFIYQIKIHDYYKEIKPDLNKYFDTSNYEVENQFQIPLVNKMALGYFKDEMKGEVVKEFVGLRPKMYVVDSENNTIKKAAGIPRAVTDNFQVKDYRNCLYRNERRYIHFYRIKAVNHDLYTQKVRKFGLSSNDPKRFILDNNVDTLPWGHYNLTEVINDSSGDESA
ncbi:unnamed protein product [Chilo suppressalis]|uniref:DNA-directed DNA polymerase n=1 Tax=Chilo suppressalis TaxID=168631 RepID=A0ABN8B9Q4_CHISP|nr:unnamed protein product [Chilo suppressalis]